MALFGPFDGGDYFLNAFTSGVLITISIASFLYIWTDRSKSGKLFLAMFKIEEELGDKGYEPRDDGTFRKKSH
ncbi:MAG: hypothetical protein H6R00_743 [Proteobacteria bacterium]|nr:hypothetical protein [Pseudomonadota bacterium]